nr:DUF1573 domain-containing protein [Thermotomaculum hydrothermale]
MKKVLGIIVINLFAVLFLFAKGPQIQFEKKLIDVGKVPIHTKVTGEFKFKNVGDEKLIIYMVKPG